MEWLRETGFAHDMRVAVDGRGYPLELRYTDLLSPDRPAQPGDFATARLVSIDRASGLRFVELPGAERAIWRSGQSVTEGELLTVRVVQEAYGDKLARVVRVADPDALHGPAWIERSSDDLPEARDDVRARDAIDQALHWMQEGRYPLDGGGRIRVDVTEAMTVIDVDTGHGAPHRFSGRLIEAAGAVIRLWGVGGIIAIDLPLLGSLQARRRAEAQLRDAARRWHSRAVVEPIGSVGVALVTLPHERCSIYDALWTRRGGRRVQGAALDAFRALDYAAMQEPTRRLSLRAGAELAAHLNGQSNSWLTAFTDRHGPRCRLDVAGGPLIEPLGWQVEEWTR